MFTLYRDDTDNAKRNAQRNLSGRTHYVDEGTLRWHKSRVLDARSYAGGLLFGVVTSDGDARGYDQGGREFRAVVFDLFGFVIDRSELEKTYTTAAAARRALFETMKSLDGMAITRAAIKRERKAFARELGYLQAKLKDMGAK